MCTTTPTFRKCRNPLLILFCYLSFNAPAQYLKPNEVPFGIKSVLDSAYPHSQHPIWKANEDLFFRTRTYQATFIDEGSRIWVLIDSSSKEILQKEKRIDKSSVP